ncbi:MAG: hypothetical protein AAFR61_28565 [Bacteroidota bacterium]
MKTPRLDYILQALDAPSRLHLRKWLEMEMGGKQPREQILLQLIWDKVPREEMWHILFPDEARDYGKLNRLREQLLRSVELYLSLEAFKKDERQRDLYFLKALNERNMPLIFPTMAKKFLKRLEKEEQEDTKQIRFRYELESEWVHYQIMNSRSTEKSRLGHRHAAFETWWVLEKLRAMCNDLATGLMDKDTQESNRMVLPWLKEELRKHMPILGTLYAELYELLDSEEKEIEHLRQKFFTHHQKFMPDRRHDFFLMMINHFSKKNLHDNKREYFLRLWEYMEHAHEHRIFHSKGFLSPRMFGTLVSIQLHALAPENRKEGLEQTRRWMQANKSHIIPAFREGAYGFAMARIFAREGNYVALKKIEWEVKTWDPESLVDYRFLLITHYYEQEELENCRLEINALLQYLKRRDRLTEKAQLGAIHALRYFKKMLNSTGSVSYWEKVQTHLADRSVPIRQRPWLQEAAQKKLTEAQRRLIIK